jgi:hypothetical protein
MMIIRRGVRIPEQERSVASFRQAEEEEWCQIMLPSLSGHMNYLMPCPPDVAKEFLWNFCELWNVHFSKVVYIMPMEKSFICAFSWNMSFFRNANNM